MDKIDVLFFYDVGSRLGRLTTSDWQKLEFSEFLIGLAHLRQDYQQLLERFPALRVCRPAGDQMCSEADELFGRLGEFAVANYSSSVSELTFDVQHALGKVVAKAKDYETVLRAEIQTLDAYHVTKIGIYSVPDLIANAEESFPNSLRIKLTSSEVWEFREAGRCLAYAIPTACAFHSLRALELVMHRYYIATCGPNDPAKLANWGAYITKFRQSSDADAKRIAELLQQLKDHDRNVIMHPDIVVSSDEAHTLFEMVQAAIMAMAVRFADQSTEIAPVESAPTTNGVETIPTSPG